MPDEIQQRRLSRELFLAAFTRNSSEVETWLLERLMSAFEEITIAAGENLFVRGEWPEYIYFIRDGSFRLERPGAQSITYNGRWVLGSFDVLAERAHPRTARALKGAEIVRLRVEDWTELLEESFSFARLVFTNAAHMVSGLYERLAPNGGLPEPAAADALGLPPGKLDWIERTLVLTGVPLLRGAGVQSLTALAANAEELRFGAGEPLAEAGRPRERLFVVAEGIFEASRERPEVSARFGPGSIVFGAAAVGEQGLPWSARALTDARVLALGLEEWFDELEDHFDAIRAALGVYAIERERLLDLIAEREGGLVLT
jgi:CRP-like cAMP-binding protein